MNKPIVHLILFSPFFKQFRLGASTVSWSKLFHLSMTRFENKYFLISVLNLGLQIYLLWPRKPLSLPSSVNKTNMLIKPVTAGLHFWKSTIVILERHSKGWKNVSIWNKKLRHCWDRSLYDKFSDSGRSANPTVTLL